MTHIEAFRRQSSRIRFTVLACVFVLSSTLPAAAAEVGSIAASAGEAEIGRSGEWIPAALGAPVHVGDELRTGASGGLRIVFQDESVLNLGSNAHLVIDEHVFDPGEGTFSSLMRLFTGKVRAIASRYYQEANASYDIETPTAVVGARGTEFVVSFDAESRITQVVGISGTVAVHSLIDRVNNGVLITAGEVTAVAAGEYPIDPRRLEDRTFRQYLDGLEFIGAGRPESLTSQHGVVKAETVPEPDRATAVGAEDAIPGGSDRPETRNTSSLTGQPDTPIMENNATGLGIRF